MALKLKPPGGDRTWSAGVLILGGIGAIVYGGITGHAFVLGLGVTMLPVGLGLWFCAPWARIVGVVLLLANSAVGVWLLVRFGASIVRVVTPIACAFFAWQIWREFDPRRIAAESESDERKPMISFALLLREPRFLDAQILAQCVSSAWGGEYIASDLESETSQEPGTEEPRWVVGRSPLFMGRTRWRFFIPTPAASIRGTTSCCKNCAGRILSTISPNRCKRRWSRSTMRIRAWLPLWPRRAGAGRNSLKPFAPRPGKTSV